MKLKRQINENWKKTMYGQKTTIPIYVCIWWKRVLSIMKPFIEACVISSENLGRNHKSELRVSKHWLRTNERSSSIINREFLHRAALSLFWNCRFIVSNIPPLVRPLFSSILTLQQSICNSAKNDLPCKYVLKSLKRKLNNTSDSNVQFCQYLS